MKVLIVHGVKSNSGGSINEAFKTRLNKALELAQKEAFVSIVITGGKTRGNTITEAAQGFEYLKERIKLPLISEERSRSTMENIRNVRDMIGNKVDEAVVIVGAVYEPRTKYLYSKIWRELKKIRFISSGEEYVASDPIRERIYRVFAYLDPNEKGIVRICKYLFRNG